MASFSLKCLVIGHDDNIRQGGGRIYLHCAECGRETRGWDLAAAPETKPEPAEHEAHGLRWIFSQVLRGRFGTAGLH